MICLVACGGGGGGVPNPTPTPSPTPTPTPAPTLQSISVAPQSNTVAAGLTDQFTATGAFSDGTSHTLTSVIWSSSDLTIATVNATGLVQTLKQGTVTVSAASGTVSGQLSFTVGPAVVNGFVIAPPQGAIIAGGDAKKFSALLTFTDKTTSDVSSQSTWTISNPFVGSVDSTGNFTASQTGLTTLAATNGSLSATLDVPVITIPRYLFFTGDSGRLAYRTSMDSSTGQLHLMGYIPTNTNGSSAFHCSTTDPSGKFLYVGSSVNTGTLSGEVQIYSVDNGTGTLTPLTGSPFPIADPADCIQFEPSGKFGFAADGVNSSTQLLTFARDAVTGTLTLQTTTNLNLTPTRPAVDPLGQYVYLAGFGAGFTTASALGFSIDPATGALTPIPGTPFSLPNTSGNFSFHPSGNFVYMADSGGTSIDVYAIQRSTGKLTAVSSIATCVNPTTVRFSPDGKFAYSACSMNTAHAAASASVESFSVAPTGTLTHIGTTPSADAPFDLNMDTSGKFIYLSSNSNYVYQFQIGADGVAKFARRIGIQANQGFSMTAVGGVTAVTTTPTFAYVSTTGDNLISTYAIAAGGSLGPPSSATAQLSPFSVSLWPWQNELLVASAAANQNVTSYQLSSTNGLPGVGFIFGNSATAGSVAVDPSGQFAFETDSTNGVVSTFFRSGTQWFLATFITPTGNVTTFKAGAGAGPISLDSAGRLVYVANQGDNTISAYQYFGTAPELNEVKPTSAFPDGSPFAIGAKPLALTVSPNGEFLYVLCGDQTVRVFSIDYFSGGHIAQLTSTPLLGQPAGIAVDPTDQFVYVADSSGLSAFSVNTQTGVLTKITLAPAIAPPGINGVYVEPSGKTLYVTTSTTGAGSILGFTINNDGTLTALAGNPLATPNQPSSIVFSAVVQ